MNKAKRILRKVGYSALGLGALFHILFGEWEVRKLSLEAYGGMPPPLNPVRRTIFFRGWGWMLKDWESYCSMLKETPF